MSKVLVTGASGFEGHYIVHDLLNHGYEVRAMVRSPERAAALDGLDVEVVYADLADHDSLRKAVRGVDHVAHPAYSVQGRNAGDPLQEFTINEGGSLVLLEEARKQGVEKFVFTSSGASVGYRSPTKWFPTYPITETSPCFPTDIYGAGKAGVEKWCLAYYHEYGVQTVTLRTMWVYGTFRIDRPELIALGSANGCPEDVEMIDYIRGHDFLGTFYGYTEKALTGEAISVPGGSFQMTHVRDLATANRLAIESSEGGEVYSVNDDLMTWKSFIERVLELTGSSSSLSFEPTPENEVNISNQRIKEKLGIEFAGMAGIDACINGMHHGIGQSGDIVMIREFTYIDHDRAIWEKELEEFVPSVVYDMHVHMWSDEHRGTAPEHGLMLPITYQDHLDWAAKLYPGREVHFLVLATPIVGMDAEGHNDYMATQMAADPDSVVNMMVTPDMTAEYIAEQVKKHNFFGLKCYRTFAPDKDDARIEDFLPEHQIELAHDMGLAITMHLSKRTGAADPDNQKDLERYTREYPGAQWILAHCARAFNAFMMQEAIHFLTGLPNIWYDTSAVNDLYSHFLLMKHEDRSRVMFGTDNVVAGCTRGKYVTWGKAWEYFPGNPTVTHCDPTPTLVCYEQLRQECQVADMLGLTKQEIEDHFSGNAKRFIAQMRAGK